MKTFDVYPLNQITPVKAQGLKLWDDKGIEYLDLYGGHAVISIGHSHPYYVNKITEQLNKIGFYSNSVLNPLREELAEKLTSLSGYNDYKLFLCNSGAEANENALKLASFETGKKNVIAFNEAFHGRTSLAVAATDNSSIHAEVNKDHHISFLPVNDIEAFDKTINNSYCAVIIEGIQGVAGINVPDQSFLEHIEKACKANNVLLILDEVQSGYGRSGKFFAHQYAAIKPDIITMAKGMGNGFPIGGLLINPEIKAKHGMLGTTFGGNHLACAAGIAVLDVLKNEQLINNANEIGNYWIKELKSIEGVKKVKGMGLMIGLEFDFPIKDLKNNLLNKHKMFVGTASNPNIIRLLPSLGITKNEIKQFNDALTKELETILIEK
ncbi:MAG: aspartate aminotransferase family protein [Bacteroidia bacterium]